ncbi:MAG TPA: Hsp70 family protein [Symbiobacteriaceae bacterium]|nr:Hsp70 family protein [Symbiobacteriaceae bacterium]
MFPVLTCLACKQWEVSPTDIYCSWCGEPLTKVSLAHDLAPFYPASAGDELQGELVLINQGTRLARVRAAAPPGFVLSPPVLELEPGGPGTSVLFTFFAPRAAFWADTIRFEVENGAPVPAKVVCSARPRLQALGEALAVTEGERGPFTVTVRNVEGGPAVVTAVKARHGRLEVAGGGEIQPGGQLALRVQLPGGAPAAGGELREVLELTLLNGGTAELPLSVTVQRPPKLGLSTDHLVFGDVLPGRTRRMPLHITNLGQGTLVVTHAALQGNDGRWTLTLPQPVPFEVRTAGEESISLAVQDAGGGATAVRLLLVTNDPQRPECYVTAEARVLANPEATDAFVGIDFGTTNSCICAARPGEQPRMLVLDEMAQDPEERVNLPSCVYWPQPPVPGDLRDCEVGRAALNMAGNPLYAHATSLSIKRRLGEQHPERILGVNLMPHEIAARIIRHLVDAAEEYLGAIVRKAVVTVPANFTPPQVRATVEACNTAGLEAEVVRRHMMDEPVGAAVDYLTTLDERQDAEFGPTFHTLVYDFGGGTLDISIIRYEFDGAARRLRVVATKGDNAFGGDDLTEILRRRLRQKAEQELMGSLPADPPEKWRSMPPGDLRTMHYTNYTLLRTAAERMKRRLSEQAGDLRQEVEDGAELELIVGRERRKQYVALKMSLGEYEDLIRERLQQTRRLVDRALTAARLREEEIPLVLMVGKSSRTPLVGKLLERWFGIKPVLHPDPKACVARGAYRKGVILSHPEFGEVTDLVRELDKTNCRYGIIVSTWRGRRFLALVPEGAAFPAIGGLPTDGPPLNARPGSRLIVALNRGDEDNPDGNGEISQLGEIVVESDGAASLLPLEVTMTVHDHRHISVGLRAGGAETRLAQFKEY